MRGRKYIVQSNTKYIRLWSAIIGVGLEAGVLKRGRKGRKCEYIVQSQTLII